MSLKRLLFTRRRGGAEDEEVFFIFYYKLFYSAISASPRAKKYSAGKWQDGALVKHGQINARGGGQWEKFLK